MELQFSFEKEKLLVRVSGELDLSVAARFRTELDSALDSKQVRQLVLDFSNVSFIDSSGLGVVLGRYRRLAEIGGTVQVINAAPQVFKILELSGLYRIMEISREDTEV